MAISMMEAYTIEVLKAHPYTFEQVKHHLENDNLQFFKKDYNMDFDLLKTLIKENPQQFKRAFEGDYEVKFVTINGLKNLLRMRFGITEAQYELLETGNGLRKLRVSPGTEQQIRKMLSSNWKVERNDETITLFV
ncbi:hypothetical protein ACTHOQ_15525 [Solibacillus silvestris]|uniref:hypothetical protein n=1 Tax=Solibacillus silvestris TaxID=76853 RepID=UPI003F7D8792